MMLATAAVEAQAACGGGRFHFRPAVLQSTHMHTSVPKGEDACRSEEVPLPKRFYKTANVQAADQARIFHTMLLQSSLDVSIWSVAQEAIRIATYPLIEQSPIGIAVLSLKGPSTYRVCL